jgi:type VI secretion system secreted protein VgrG
MAIVRGYPNAGHFYSNIVSPVKVDIKFIVDSSNPLGIRSLKSNGFLKSLQMNGVVVPPGTPAFGTARSFGLLGGSAVSNTGSSVINGNIGVYPGSAITGFPPGVFTGSEHITDAAAQAAQASAQAAYTDLQARSSTVIATELGGQSLGPGVYSSAGGTFQITGGMTLTLTGSATDIFVFKTATTLITGVGAGGQPVILLAGGAKASNVYWAVGSSATINSAASSAGATFQGNVIAQASVTATQTGIINGSLVALTGAVTLSAANVVNAQPLSSSMVGSPLPGYALMQFNNNFNKYLGGFVEFEAPLDGSNVAVSGTSLVLGQAYVISVVGTSTLADWQAVGLPKGLTPAVGQSFIAIKSGNGAGSGQVQKPAVAGVNSVEVVGDPDLEIANSSIAQNGGAVLLLQFLLQEVLTAPVDGTVVWFSAFFDNSSVTVDGL